MGIKKKVIVNYLEKNYYKLLLNFSRHNLFAINLLGLVVMIDKLLDLMLLMIKV